MEQETETVLTEEKMISHVKDLFTSFIEESFLKNLEASFDILHKFEIQNIFFKKNHQNLVLECFQSLSSINQKISNLEKKPAYSFLLQETEFLVINTTESIKIFQQLVSKFFFEIFLIETELEKDIDNFSNINAEQENIDYQNLEDYVSFSLKHLEKIIKN